MTDPDGKDAFLVAREIWPATGFYHMFVVVAPTAASEPQARFSFGPGQAANPLTLTGPGSLVEQRGSGSATDVGDIQAWRTLRDPTHATTSISVTRIKAPDQAVIASGARVDEVLGNVATPTGAIQYRAAPNPLSDPTKGNSNSAAMAVANGALPSGQEQQLPNGVIAPGWGQFQNIQRMEQNQHGVPSFKQGGCPSAGMLGPGTSCGGGLEVWGQ